MNEQHHYTKFLRIENLPDEEKKEMIRNFIATGNVSHNKAIELGVTHNTLRKHVDRWTYEHFISRDANYNNKLKDMSFEERLAIEKERVGLLMT